MRISDKTRKLLWGRAGNRCAVCQRALIMPGGPNADPSVVGDECHIVSSAPNGPRYNPEFVGDPNDCTNLILLCKTDHKRVDDQEVIYTAEKLQHLKQLHEAAVEKVLHAHFSGSGLPSDSKRFDNFRTIIWFVPDQREAALEAFQQRLITEPRLTAYAKVGTGFKMRGSDRYASWIQSFLPVSADLLRTIGDEVGVKLLDVSYVRLPGL